MNIQERLDRIEIRQRNKYTRVIIATKKLPEMSLFMIHLYLPEADIPQIDSWALQPEKDPFQAALHRLQETFARFDTGTHIEFICRDPINPDEFPYLVMKKELPGALIEVEEQLDKEIEKRCSTLQELFV